MRRTTASLSYNKAWECTNWQTTAAWGLNQANSAQNGFLLESTIQIDQRHVLFGRFETVAKNELFAPPNPKAEQIYQVSKIDFGYIFEFPLFPFTLGGIGAVGSASFVPHSLEKTYGGTPLSYMIFFRIDLIGSN